MARETSFISEHTAEFALVPEFARIAATRYRRVTPVFFWRTREGTSAASRPSARAQMGIRVVAVFARRPKVLVSGQDFITMKINSQLLRDAGFWGARGMPTFAGVPRASSLDDMCVGVECSWFYLRDVGPAADEFVSLRVEDGALHGLCPNRIDGPLGEGEILDHIARSTRPMAWVDAVEVIKSTQRETETGRWPFGFAGYKPVFFLLAE